VGVDAVPVGVGEWNRVSDDRGQSPAQVVALADQIHAAIRGKDSGRLADTVRAVSSCLIIEPPC
jgi:hypothetical protein